MTWFATIACVLFPAYFLIDVNYFIRTAFTIIFAKSRKRIRFLDPSSIYGFVLTSDIDFLLTHMNNARFLRELDFARIDHGTRSDFMPETMSRGGMILLSSSFIRYRLPLPVFSRYKIVTNVVWWDEKNVYLNHKVITLRDDIIRAVIYARASCLKVNVHEIVEKISPGTGMPDKDSIAPDYKKWMETLELSSQLMKANRNIKAVDDKKSQQNGCLNLDTKPSKENGNGGIGSGDIISTCTANSKEVSTLETMNLLHMD